MITYIKPDPNWVLAIAIALALKGDTSLLEKLEKEAKCTK